MEMLPLVKIAPEYNLTLDPSTGMIGAALGREVIILSMDEINEQIAELEATADDLINSLDPTTIPQGSYPGREGVYLTAGKLTNMVYGFILGLIILFALLL
ncbi:tetrahydromethanopterin S-methyltransferase subunit B [Methanothermobacter thermautotrophicus]|jgi:tetrahydromethanopterin S-methyltransferase subunit B|uniref:Tetrahydromethanopterin S-methyltransferase subunit B n=1 Tax=Methanothermobacter thermautotrophicus TaxID=145262 RepID=A0A842YMP1_METTF|nr:MULTISPECIES: tetrahydromethanopterin S-methyltransferase subunit B [Methanothermobacter]MBC7111028.1 tetrahydromethanopterin S-methyltransferase subunit B [Methanothermobacter sp.]MBE2900237.1 tetrahydromethanopterin S-methyltransferase subunit B [Methanothermobacter thermautotrophicus]MCQ8905270.1 tetrahydromethanopterin S-methyltransferase subunit B [Methanothermobacter sp.]WBF07506.1 tetrahydromethanopterin S-methyltransferase subunit B [Methanothermobacter thermautotrophicus]BAM70302.1